MYYLVTIENSNPILLETNSETKFLKDVLSKENVKSFSYGFFSEADWELHLQTVLQSYFKSRTLNSKREQPFPYKAPFRLSSSDESDNVVIKRAYNFEKYTDTRFYWPFSGAVDFEIVEGAKKYAIEFKVETYHEESYGNRVFAGLSAFDAFKSDIMKLKHGTKAFDQKWSILIARSPKQRNQLQQLLRDLDRDPHIHDGGLKSCWFMHQNEGFVALLHRFSKGNEEKCKIRKIGLITNLGRKFQNQFVFMKPSGCRNKFHQFPTDNPEEAFLSIIQTESATFKKALPKGGMKVNAWEKHAQVVISKKLQCDTNNFSYGEKLREHSGFGGNRKKVDLLLKRKYAIEVKVEVQANHLEGSKTFNTAMYDEITKMKTWKPSVDGQSRWLFAIMNADTKNCNTVYKWSQDRSSSIAKTCDEWGRLGSPMMIGSKSISNGIRNSFFTNAYTWVSVSGDRSDIVLYVLVCLERRGEPNTCTGADEVVSAKRRRIG